MKRSIALGLGMAALVAPVATAPAALAWGPTDRPTYTNEAPANHAVFNSITNNAAVGDERDFVRIAEKKAGAVYESDIEVEAGKQYEVYIYYHNNASGTYNDKAHNYAGVARDVRVVSDFPDELAKGEVGTVMGKITAMNTDPKTVWDEAFIRAKEDITLHYVTGSAKIYNSWGVNGAVLSENLFSEVGTFIGLNELNGVILGCDEYSGQIVYTIQTKAVAAPVVPDDPTPDPDPIPEELPNTGPIEIGLAIVLVLVVVAGVAYYAKTHREVRKVSRKAKGRK